MLAPRRLERQGHGGVHDVVHVRDVVHGTLGGRHLEIRSMEIWRSGGRNLEIWGEEMGRNLEMWSMEPWDERALAPSAQESGNMRRSDRSLDLGRADPGTKGDPLIP